LGAGADLVLRSGAETDYSNVVQRGATYFARGEFG